MSVPVEKAEVVRQLTERGYVEAARSPKHVLYLIPGSDARPVVLPEAEWVAPGVYRMVAAATADAPERGPGEAAAAFRRLDAVFARNRVDDPVAAVRALRDER